MSLDVSPDGEALTFDLLGDLYLLPINGGEAVPLTTGRAWDQAPRFSPEGKSVYFVSDREGFKNIWRVTLADGSVQQVTASAADVVGTPNWSRGGSSLLVGIADADTRNTEFILHRVDPGSGAMTPLEVQDGPWIDLDDFSRRRDPIVTYSGVQAADGRIFTDSRLDQQNGRVAVHLHSLDPATQTRTAITPPGAGYVEYKPQVSHDGRLLAYFRQYDDRHTELRILDTVTAADNMLTELSDADDASYRGPHDSRPNYAFTPDDRHVIFWHHGKIHRVALVDGTAEIIPFNVKVVRDVWQRVKPAVQVVAENGVARVARWPGMSHDGRFAVVTAIGYVWIVNANSGESRRLTQSSDFEYMPSLSPDGGSAAYVSFAQLEKGYGPARLMVAGIDSGSSRELLTAVDETFLLPNWSADGGKIALIRETTGDDGVETAFGWTRVSDGAFHEVASAPTSGSRANLYLYARYVGFDQTGRNLLFSYPTSITETALAAAELDGGTVRLLAIGTPEVAGITPAPDLRHLALTRRDGTVWVVPFEAADDPVEVSTSSSGARRVSDGGGYYVRWHGPDEITFGFARRIYRYRLTEGELSVMSVKVAFPKPKAPRPVALRGARLITMTGGRGAGRVIEQGTIVLEGQRISALGPVGKVTIPDDALVIDARGNTIMPGLLDTHYHRIGGTAGQAAGLSAFKLPNPSFSDRSAMAYGITTAWEPAGPTNDGVPATADLQVAGRILGPRWSYAAMGVVGYPFDQLTSYGAAVAAVRQHRELGVKVLKEYNTPTREQRQWLSAAAREQELGIVSHLGGFDSMMTRVVDGYTGGDHATIPIPFFRDVRELLRQTGYIWTPNVVITPGTVGTRSDRLAYFWREVLETRPDELERLRARTSYRPDVAEPSVPHEVLRIHRVAKAAGKAAKAGARIGVSAHNMPGALLHAEMWHLWKGGLPAADVLRAATMINARKLGLQDEVGSLEIGKIADILVLERNPLEDVINTLTIKYTVQGGVVYDAATAERADLSAL